MSSRITPLVFFLIACLGPATSATLRAERSNISDEARGRFGERLPQFLGKLVERRDVHVTFVGDPLWLNDEAPQRMVPSFLRQLEATFFYTGGVYRIDAEEHLEERRPKITYECRPTNVRNPGSFQLMQYVSTEGLVNEPDLLVLCAGPGDPAAGLDLDTALRVFDELLALARAAGAEIITMAPRAFDFEDDRLALRLDSRAVAVALRHWAEVNQLAFFDPNPEVFPRSVLFLPEDDAQAIWNGFLGDSLDWIQGREPSATIDGRRQQAVGTALFESLVEPPANSHFRLKGRAGERLAVALENQSEVPLGGLIVPSLEGQRGGLRFQPTKGALSFEWDRPSNLSATLHGRWPVSVIVIDDRRVEWLDTWIPANPVGVEWLDHAHHNNRGVVPVRIRLHPYENAPERLPYRVTLGDKEARGTVTFLQPDRPADIEWAVELPKDAGTRTFQDTLRVRLGSEREWGVHERRLDAMRQFPLATKVPLRWVAFGGAQEPKNIDPLTVGEPEASMTMEATENDLTIHVDLRNMEIVEHPEEPSLQVDLALDARSHDRRQNLGYVGVLFVAAGPKDGPAEISPFAGQAHFGNGYARRPLPPGRVARLSTLPNGIRRLTIQMSSAYFYRYPWELGNFNSQLRIGLSLALARPGKSASYRYVLFDAPRAPHNAEDLVVVELAEKGSGRWCVQWSP